MAVSEVVVRPAAAALCSQTQDVYHDDLDPAAGRPCSACLVAARLVLDAADVGAAVPLDLNPKLGDQVLILGRVVRSIPGVGVLVELFSKSDQYEAWIRWELIRGVIPGETTRTHTGARVPDVRAAIAELDGQIAAVAGRPGGGDAASVYVEALIEARAGLAAQLDAIGLTVVP